jgi:hypothetical protein
MISKKSTRAARKRVRKRAPAEKRTAKKRSPATRSARGLRRAAQPMPVFVRSALSRGGLLAKYRARPAFQRNDYLRWIASAKQDETKRKRLAQMIAELRAGNRYMKMRWRPRA